MAHQHLVHRVSGFRADASFFDQVLQHAADAANTKCSNHCVDIVLFWPGNDICDEQVSRNTLWVTRKPGQPEGYRRPIKEGMQAFWHKPLRQ